MTTEPCRLGAVTGLVNVSGTSRDHSRWTGQSAGGFVLGDAAYCGHGARHRAGR